MVVGRHHRPALSNQDDEKEEGGGAPIQSLSLEEASCEVVIDPLERSKVEIVTCYLKLFPRLVHEGEGVADARDPPPSLPDKETEAKGEVSLEVFRSSCHLLLQMSLLGGGETGDQGRMWD